MALSPAMLRVLKARDNVAQRDRWFADVIYCVRIIETEATETMDTNGRDIRFNPKWVMDADNVNHIEGAFCHEAWHVILDHVRRQSGRDNMVWNIACDAVINPMVLNRGWTLPAKRVMIDAVVSQRMSAERAYEFLRDNAIKLGISLVRGSEDMKQHSSPKEEEELADFRRKIERAIQQATETAIGNRSMNNDVLKNIKPDKTHRKVTWQEATRDMIDKRRNLDSRTWSRPNRRHLGNGIIRPGYLRDKINRLAVGFDVSGSITQHNEYLKEMKGEAARLLDEGHVTNVLAISVDTEVQARGDLTSPQAVIDFDLRARGGGTNFRGAMAEIARLEDCVGCIFLTDMQTSNFGQNPGFPVTWVNWGPEVQPGHQYYPPFGTVINYKELRI